MNTTQDMPGIQPHDVEDYVASTMHAPLALRPWPGANDLAPYLRQPYRYFEGELSGTQLLWLLVDGEPPTPKTVQKHVSALTRVWPAQPVVAFESLASYDRQRLIQHGVDFVVPGTQLYLPAMGIDFRARAKKARHLFDVVLRPSTQVLLLHLLEVEEGGPWTATEIAPVLGYTKMTMARAVAQLEDAQLIRVNRTGRANEFILAPAKREIWDVAQSRLLDPVVRRVLIHGGDFDAEPLAGLTALAGHTMLAEPRVPVHAIGLTRAGELDTHLDHDPTLPVTDDNDVEIEVWSYDPRVLSDGPTVDLLSLYLSLRDDVDERVQSALEQLLKGAGL
jgi:DNA-binding MarR family transcriptional regulator